MKRIFTLLGIIIGTASFGQVFESTLSSWAAGDPTDFMGAKTNIPSGQVTEQTIGVTYGTSMASLINATTGHMRFTTVSTPVTGGETYEIRMWVAASQGEIRTSHYDVTNDSYGTYNPYVDLTTESGGSLVLVTQTVTVAPTCTNAEFIISIVNTEAVVGVVIDSVTIQLGTPPPSTELSIYDIQYTTDASGDSPEEGNLVTTRGIVTGVLAFGADAGKFFIQDGSGPFTGIYIYEGGTTVALGDSVVLTGTVTEYFGYTELTGVTGITVLASGLDLPEGAVVTTAGVADEQYESVVVTTEAICTNESMPFGQFELNDGSGAVLVDDEIFSYTPTLGNGYEVTGVNHFSFDEYKILPRIIADITTTGFAGVEDLEQNNLSIYPNPANELFYISGSSVNSVVIYSLDGAEVLAVSNTNEVNIADLSSGVYIVNIASEGNTLVEKLIVK